jgi:hypothetical protein
MVLHCGALLLKFRCKVRLYFFSKKFFEKNITFTTFMTLIFNKLENEKNINICLWFRF